MNYFTKAVNIQAAHKLYKFFLEHAKVAVMASQNHLVSPHYMNQAVQIPKENHVL